MAAPAFFRSRVESATSAERVSARARGSLLAILRATRTRRSPLGGARLSSQAVDERASLLHSGGAPVTGRRESASSVASG